MRTTSAWVAAFVAATSGVLGTASAQDTGTTDYRPLIFVLALVGFMVLVAFIASKAMGPQTKLDDDGRVIPVPIDLHR